MPGKRMASIRNKDQYEKLRKKGMSKEKAARIANAPSGRASKRGGNGKTYEEWTKDELHRKAKEVGIEGRSDMNKEELIRAQRRGT
jgi:hypothetical protein